MQRFSGANRSPSFARADAHGAAFHRAHGSRIRLLARLGRPGQARLLLISASANATRNINPCRSGVCGLAHALGGLCAHAPQFGLGGVSRRINRALGRLLRTIRYGIMLTEARTACRQHYGDILCLRPLERLASISCLGFGFALLAEARHTHRAYCLYNRPRALS